MGGPGPGSPGLGRCPKRGGDDGKCLIRDGMAAVEATGARVAAPLNLTLLAEALALAGKIEEGLAALEDPAKGRPTGESVLTRERHAIIAIGADGGDIPGEDRGHPGMPEGVGKGVGMPQLPAQCERTIGSSRGLIRIAAMPERPGQDGKGADPDVQPVVPSSLARSALCRQTPKVGAGCLNWARPDPCGGCPEMAIPTAILGQLPPFAIRAWWPAKLARSSAEPP